MPVAILVAALATVESAAAVIGNQATRPEIEQIVVTARRVEEPLADLPLSATVLDAASIARLGADSLDDLARFTPGLSFESATGRGPNSNRPSMRGLTTIQNGIANSTVAATFIDGVYLGGSIQSASLYDLERVEIVRGPQSAQFGRATEAGAINYVTRRPSAEFTAGANLTAATYDTDRLNGWVSGPIAGDWLRGFFGAGTDRYGGEYRNTRDGSTVGGEESRDVSLKLEAMPGRTLDMTLRLGLQSTDDAHYAMWLQPRTANNCCFRTVDAPRAREYYIGDALTSRDVTLYTDALQAAGGAGIQLDRALGSLNVRWETPLGPTLTSLTGIVRDHLDRGFDASYAAYDPVPSQPGSFLIRDRLRQGDFSEELRLASAQAGRWRWTAGLYYYKGYLDTVTRDQVVVAANDSVSVHPVSLPPTFDEVENHAVFGAIEADLPHAVIAALELRYAADRVRVSPTPAVSEASYRSLSPRLTVSWQATAGLMPYLNIGRGGGPGTFNKGKLPDESYRKVDEEVAWSYEFGLRGALFDGRTTFALAGYYMDVRNQQATQIVELPDGTTTAVLANVGRIAVKGIEAEGSASLGDNLKAGITYAWTDSKYRRQVSVEEADLLGSSGSPADIQALGNVAGHRVPRVPEHKGSLWLEYRAPLTAASAWFAGGDWSYESSRYAQEDNLIETGARSLLGVHAGVALAHVQLKLWVVNLTDDDTPVDVQRYIDSRFGTLASFPYQGSKPSSTPRGFGISLPRGRQFGATLSSRF